jgi:hypothetical protein
LRDGDVGRGDEHVPGSGGKELRHVEARRATDDRADVRFADQAAELVDAAARRERPPRVRPIPFPLRRPGDLERVV